MTDLRKLIEAVEGPAAIRRAWAESALNSKRLALYVDHAANGGSLDAAKALHEELLPGWLASVGFAFDGGEVLAIVGPTGREDRDHEGKLTGPSSRAWLIAIFKAYEAQQ